MTLSNEESVFVVIKISKGVVDEIVASRNLDAAYQLQNRLKQNINSLEDDVTVQKVMLEPGVSSE